MLMSLSRAALITVSGLLALPALAQDAPPPVAAGPANLCRELKAFVTAPEPKKQEASTPPSQSTAVSNPSGKSDAQPSGSAGDPQQKSGLSGATDSKAPPADVRKSELAHANAIAKPAAAPAALPPPPKPDATTVATIEDAAARDDQASCRAAALTLRKAGVPMPLPLLALAALDLKFQKAQ